MSWRSGPNATESHIHQAPAVKAAVIARYMEGKPKARIARELSTYVEAAFDQPVLLKEFSDRI